MNNTTDLGLILPAPTGSGVYLREILTQLGLLHIPLDLLALKNEQSLPRILIIPGPLELSTPQVQALDHFVRLGGGIMFVGPVQGADILIGAELNHPKWLPFPVGGAQVVSLGEGYCTTEDPWLRDTILEDWWPLHGFGCSPLYEDTAKVLAWYEPTTGNEKAEKWPAITFQQVGEGSVLGFHIDLVRTVRYIQEGRYVDQDGIPPADGLSPLEDGTLKCEDGLVLDWVRDRRIVSQEHKVSAFTIPVVDLWRDVLLSSLEILADRTGTPLKRVDYWPDGVPFIGLLSHDSDGNDPAKARRLLTEVNTLDIQTTWCLQAPGYDRSLCEEIQKHGHELAFHFDAQSFPGVESFTREMLGDQLEDTVDFTGVPAFYSNKNHYTRWEGRVDFFEWCAELGIKVDQSKGPSKCGTLGFPFGSAHPWLPMDNAGKVIECLEISFQSQDFGLQGPRDTGNEILAACQRVHGVAHVIFHPAHVDKNEVRASMQQFVNEARARGARFMTSQAIGEWIFQRRAFIQSGANAPLGVRFLVRDPSQQTWTEVD